jgi:hypothetical protein
MHTDRVPRQRMNLQAIAWLAELADYTLAFAVRAIGAIGVADHPHRRPLHIDELAAQTQCARHVQSRLRMVNEPIQIDGRVIGPGRLLLLIGSANRDERQFDRPDEVDIAPTPNRHVSFGGGEHYCLGASLAQLECRLAFGYLVHGSASSSLQPSSSAVRWGRSAPTTGFC